jgi:hypothetical protein
MGTIMPHRAVSVVVNIDHISRKIKQTRRPYFQGCRPDELNHLIICDSLCAYRAFSKTCSRSAPEGSSSASSPRRLASSARRSRSCGWGKRRCCCMAQSFPLPGAAAQHSVSPMFGDRPMVARLVAPRCSKLTKGKTGRYPEGRVAGPSEEMMQPDK